MKKQMWFCETCNENYCSKSRLPHLHSNKHEFKKSCLYYEKLYRELYPVYEDYRLCQIKGFIENMPYMSFLEFICKCELINHHIKLIFFRKFPEEEKYDIIEKGYMTIDEFVKLSQDELVLSIDYGLIESSVQCSLDDDPFDLNII